MGVHVVKLTERFKVEWHSKVQLQTNKQDEQDSTYEYTKLIKAY